MSPQPFQALQHPLPLSALLPPPAQFLLAAGTSPSGRGPAQLESRVGDFRDTPTLSKPSWSARWLVKKCSSRLRQMQASSSGTSLQARSFIHLRGTRGAFWHSPLTTIIPTRTSLWC
ncbi:hypothetical protein SNOG_01816 [Parastagonospora nodorum SN15]|uniref:Uncharacterized protein n=1 Tax=Phaeosphaeria nodorum (strain SN15 / ATCC MYA-4574 / FGSC 10173) TaxID=321614 RepID=Q0V2E8_PHANO|nr:hypothetical protein SNOG_01816 [Parastagonospora nodorum SN15]EAT91465.2 hypothetical protein SNOG_01816 [Parastagonospora nodorum SN15]